MELKIRLTLFQKNPTFLFHRHLVRLFPTDALPSSQTCIHVDPSHVISFTPAGNANGGQFDHKAAALIPTGCPQPVDRCLSKGSNRSLYHIESLYHNRLNTFTF